MCGITGWVDYDQDLTARTDVARDMADTMSCRGPDGSGVWVRSHVALGHRRLAVIDPQGGAQPMVAPTPNGDVALVYSGEVYNYTELRDELRRRGHRFITASDTEVVLRGYLEWGEDVAQRLNGMFAMAIWDERDRRLVLIRDRMGIKPLYYYPTRGGVLFGSEPKAILANPGARRAVDADGLRELVGFTMAPGWALWRGMREVLPGQVATVAPGGIRTRTYWSLPLREHTDDRPTTIATVRDLMHDIVGRQLVADVPLGVLLSGGLDSSVITGIAAGHLAGSGRRPRTYSVDYTGREDTFRADQVWGTPDTPYIRAVADLHRCEHTTLELKPDELADPALRRAVIAARDLPFTNGDQDTSLYLLLRAMRPERTVLLSGESADEVFGGYVWMHDRTAVDTPTFPWLAFRSPLSGDRTAPLREDLRRLLDIDTYVADQYATAVAAVDQLPGASATERRMREVTNLHLTRFVRMLLDRKDRISMAVGMEVRVPYCDHRLVEYVYNVPWSEKSFDGREKSLLRHACSHLVPASVAGRVKAPYPSTQDPGYAAALQQQARELLGEPGHPVFGLVDRTWLAGIARWDPAELALPSDVRRSLDRVLDLYHWLDLYRPELP